jgi:hypothetical protein
LVRLFYEISTEYAYSKFENAFEVVIASFSTNKFSGLQHISATSRAAVGVERMTPVMLMHPSLCKCGNFLVVLI